MHKKQKYVQFFAFLRDYICLVSKKILSFALQI